MNVEQSELDRWASFADRMRNQTLRLERLLAGGQVQEACRLASELHREAAWTLTTMRLAGAEGPTYLPILLNVPLELLASPANRRLYESLSDTVQAAREVDQERGIQGHGTADFFEDRLARVEREVFGPSGLDNQY